MLQSEELRLTPATRTPDVRRRIRFPPGSPDADIWVSVGRDAGPAVVPRSLSDAFGAVSFSPPPQSASGPLVITWLPCTPPHVPAPLEVSPSHEESSHGEDEVAFVGDECDCESDVLGDSPVPLRSFALPVVPVVTAPQYFGTEGISWLDGLPSKWDSRLRYEYCPSSFGLVHGQRCNLCGAVVDLKLHSTICSIRCCTGRCVCLDSLVAKALLELPPAPSPVLRLPVWVVQSFLESWPSEPSDPNWLQHFFSVDQAFSTQISGLDVLLRERSQLLKSPAGNMAPVLCGAAPESCPSVVCQLCGDLLPTKCFSRRMLRWDREAQMVCKVCLLRWGDDPSVKFARFWLLDWFFWWVHCSGHPGYADIPPFDVLDFQPWRTLEYYEDDIDDDIDCGVDDMDCGVEDYDDIWETFDVP